MTTSIHRMPNISKRSPVSEMIGRVRRSFTRFFTGKTIDETQADYGWYDKLRRGKLADFELGGLFARPIARILSSWALGKGFTAEIPTNATSRVRLNARNTDATQTAIQKFIKERLIDYITAVDNGLSLGDCYVVINPDGSMVEVSPDQVEVITEPKGSKNVVGYKITTRLDDQTITDEFRADKRVQTIEQGGKKTVTPYLNLTGLIPVIPYHNEQSANELYGHPEVEGLIKNFLRYNGSLDAAMNGTELMGNPVVVIEDDPDPLQTWNELNGETEDYENDDLATRTRNVVDFNPNEMYILRGKLNFKSAQAGFTSDTERMLGILFLLMLQHSGIPEWCWGGAIASSKASVDAQMPAFILRIDGVRMKLERFLLNTLRVYLATIALYTPDIVPDVEIVLSFPSIIGEDRKQKLDELKYARDEQLITKPTALGHLNIVEDPETEVADAEAEAATARENAIDPVDQALTDLINRDKGQTDPKADPANADSGGLAKAA